MTIDAETRATLRPATEADLTAIERALVEADLPVDGVAAALSQFVVADAGAGAIAAAGLEWHGDAALLRSVVVAPQARRRGLARALVDDLLARAAERCADVFLLTTNAERYFATLGFTVIDRSDVPAEIRASAEFASICPADATVMRHPAIRRAPGRGPE
jgi:amino-acid N-acetyltransferase